MTQLEMNTFRAAMMSLRDELIGNSGRGRETLTIEATSDDLDRLQNASDREYAIGNLERNARRLEEVQDALRRMDAGAFGVCVGCDGDINARRLAAVPWASQCIACQEAADSLRKGAGGEPRPDLLAA